MSKKNVEPETVEDRVPRCSSWVDFGRSYGRVQCWNYEGHPPPHEAATTPAINSYGGTVPVKLTWRDPQ